MSETSNKTNIIAFLNLSNRSETPCMYTQIYTRCEQRTQLISGVLVSDCRRLRAGRKIRLRMFINHFFGCLRQLIETLVTNH